MRWLVASLLVLSLLLVGCEGVMDDLVIDPPVIPEDNLVMLTENYARLESYDLSDYQGSILYGPYRDDKFDVYYVNGDLVLDDSFSVVEKPYIMGLHKFYLKALLEPIFFSPFDSEDEIDFKVFKNFSQDQFLARECGLEMDIYPVRFMEELTINHRFTMLFFEYPSYETALSLLLQNEKTVDAYLEGVNGLIDSLQIDLSSATCNPQSELEDYDRMNYMFGTAHSNHTITYNLIVDNVKRYNNNAMFIEHELSKRKSILRGDKIYELPSVNVDPDYEGSYDIDDIVKNETIRRLYNAFFTEDNTTYFISEDDPISLYEVDLNCFSDEPGLLYGVDKDLYPNVMLACRADLKNEYYKRGSFDSPFTSCTCPYVEELRLYWYLIDDMVSKVQVDKLSDRFVEYDSELLKSAEDLFLEYPSQRNVEYLGSVYKSTLYGLLRDDKFHPIIPELIRRSTQIDSKIYLFKKTFDDYYNEERNFGF